MNPYPTKDEILLLATRTRLPPAFRLPLRKLLPQTLESAVVATRILARLLGLPTNVVPAPSLPHSKYHRPSDTVLLARNDLLEAVHELMHALLGPSERVATVASLMMVEAEWPGWLASVPSWNGHDPSTRPW